MYNFRHLLTYIHTYIHTYILTYLLNIPAHIVVDIAANQWRMIRIVIIKQNSLTFKAVV